MYDIKPTWKINGFDIDLDLGGDTFTTYYGIRQFLRHVSHLFLLWLFRQPYIIFAQTLSNYGVISSKIARFFLKRAVLVTVREKRSLVVAKKFGVNAIETADIAWIVKGIGGDSYYGHSYHQLILAAINGKEYRWDGDRDQIFKFDIFKEPINIQEMRKNARRNFEMLQSILDN